MFDSPRTLLPPVCDPHTLFITYTLLILLINSTSTKTRTVIFSLNPACTHAPLILSHCLALLTSAEPVGDTTGLNTNLSPTSAISPSFDMWGTMEPFKGKAYILWPKNTSNRFDR